MILHQGRFNGVQLLRPQTVALMNQNQIGDITAGIAKTAMPERSNDIDLFPGSRAAGVGLHDHDAAGPNGRSAAA